MSKKYEIIDDFLPQREFEKIQKTLMVPSPNTNEKVGWIYTSEVGNVGVQENWKHFYMTHHIYAKGLIFSFVYEKIAPILMKLDLKALIRIKANLYPNSEKILEHDTHVDAPWPHKAAIFSINTCDGYTKLEDGSKIDSVANRMLFFDGSTPHSSTTTSDTTVRINMGFNYF